ncbi:MAG: DNA polymerase Y family protein [Ferruginibacter sp.]
MIKRFVAVWFRHLNTDWMTRRQPGLKGKPFILAAPDHGKMIITAASPFAQVQGVNIGMAVADARAIIPSLQVFDDEPERPAILLKAIAEWCIRYTPLAAIDLPDGLILDVTGCVHLWGGEQPYLDHIIARLNGFGYEVKAAMADTVGAAWAIARFGQGNFIIDSGGQTTAMLSLPATALRLGPGVLELLQKLGLRQVKNIIGLPRAALGRRFGKELITRLDQAMGHEEEITSPVQPVEIYQERLPCLEPIVTATGIQVALQRLLEKLCASLQQVQKGLRRAVFKCYRADGKIEKISIGTHRASYNEAHLFKLLELHIPSIEPASGIELFTLDALQIEDVSPLQEKIWEGTGGLQDTGLAELMDRLANKIGAGNIHRYLPDEHYWPERSIKTALSLCEPLPIAWQANKLRPIQLLTPPEPIEVTALVPDYPPMLFRYNGTLYKIKKADGPERIEREWWLKDGPHRDYYRVEDEEGRRYWLFKSGHYTEDKTYRWFIHGFFA